METEIAHLAKVRVCNENCQLAITNWASFGSIFEFLECLSLSLPPESEVKKELAIRYLCGTSGSISKFSVLKLSFLHFY